MSLYVPRLNLIPKAVSEFFDRDLFGFNAEDPGWWSTNLHVLFFNVNGKPFVEIESRFDPKGPADSNPLGASEPGLIVLMSDLSVLTYHGKLENRFGLFVKNTVLHRDSRLKPKQGGKGIADLFCLFCGRGGEGGNRPPGDGGNFGNNQISDQCNDSGCQHECQGPPNS